MLPAARIVAIRAKAPSEARIARYMKQAGGIRAAAIELAHAEHIAWAEAQQTRTIWNGSYGPKKGARALPSFTTLTDAQRDVIGAGIDHDAQALRRAAQNRDMLEQDIVDRAVAAQPHAFTSGTAGEAPTRSPPSEVGASLPSKRKAA